MTEEASVPVEFVIDRIAKAELPTHGARLARIPFDGDSTVDRGSVGVRIYQANCASCHGMRGEGGIKVKNLGVRPTAFVTTLPFRESVGLQSAEGFSHVVTRGLPGDLMPAVTQLSTAEIRELYQYVHGLK